MIPVIQDILQEGALTFIFPEGASASKYDDWSHYRNQYQSICGGSKAVDIVYLEQKTAWLIEVKDYRINRRTKAIDLADEITEKVRDTLAGLVSAQFQANDVDEKKCARGLLRAQRLRIVCHLEQPAKHSKLRPRAIEPDKLQLKLRLMLKSIDPHPAVVDSKKTYPQEHMSWDVSG